MLDCLVMLHFHIGSQITDIRKIKEAISEAGRVYAKLRGLGVPIRYLNLGGGLGVDYDGSKTAFDSSMNYTVQEYANDVVYTVKQICDEEKVPAPVLVTESGRAVTAYHSVFVTNVLDVADRIQEGRRVRVAPSRPQRPAGARVHLRLGQRQDAPRELPRRASSTRRSSSRSSTSATSRSRTGRRARSSSGRSASASTGT